MSNTNPVYYFSGTGGCLAAARRISEELPGFSPVPIAALRGESSITVDADAIGLVFPLYYTGLPRIAVDFIKKLVFTRPCYVFAVIACGNPQRSHALRQLQRLLAKKGAALSAGFTIKLASGYLPYNDLLSPEKLEQANEAGDRMLELVLEHLKKRDAVVEREAASLVYLIYPHFIRASKRYDKYFSADNHCTSCGICQSVCPVNNVQLENGRPRWRHQCQFCLACIHYCPQRAIQWKDITQSRGRYHYKGITAADISDQKRQIKQ